MPESAENLELMKLIDQKYTEKPFLGSRRIMRWLNEDQSRNVNRKRIQRLMRLMRLEVIYPKPRLTQRNLEHRVFPYLLRNVVTDRPNQVWSTDITYIRLQGGFIYLTAIIDWHTRYVVAWELSNTLDAGFCVSTLERALSYGQPDVFNTDQGCQYTCKEHVAVLEAKGISIGMNGRGRCMDNILCERLWRTVKYEEVYINDYATADDAFHRLKRYFAYYNFERQHQSLGYQTPASLYQPAGSSRHR